ncbi:MAG: hypothetical protein JWM68_4699 [Verrucomicrobiales bacterium]|nr:hypothetical protein [Verrucomicrobiales bacterium]
MTQGANLEETHAGEAAAYMNLVSTKRFFRCVFFIALLFAFPGVGPSAELDSAFIPKHANIVLLAGIAGDVETEKEFRDQLHSWFDAISASGATPNKVFLVSDIEPDTSPSELPLQKLKAAREDFLTLSKTLADSTNELLVIAWGHGGMQGRTPVFHVRGPRITPADFKSLAATQRGGSRWVLYFRGSGSFARELVASGRQIISSENETVFASDPIGSSLLVKRLTGDPNLTFDKASEELGSATGSWYRTRNLARTEEPTLWNGMEKPKALTQKESTLSSSPVLSEWTNAVNAVKSYSPEGQTNLPATWKEIQKVEAQKYPEADAVVLSLKQIYTIGSKPALSTEHEEFIQILTEEGKHEGDFDFRYAPPFEDIAFLACEVLKPNGQLLKLDPEEIRDANESSVSDYNPGKRKFFSLPDVAPGAVLHVHYRTTWQTFPMPHVSTKIPLASDAPILKESVRVSIPRTATFHFSFSGTEPSDPELKQSDYGTTYNWHFENIAAHAREALSPPGREPHLLISTFPDWSSFSDWYGRISKLSDEITPEISAKAMELTRAAKTNPEKILALYNYVTGLRYVAVEMGVNSFRPHAAANVLKNQFGDCKDKANLFNTLIRSLKADQLDAHLVLVPRFTQADEATPGLAFNHAISRVTLGTETIWVDTTDDVCRFGMLPPGDPGRKVFIMDGKATSLAQLPSPLARDHRVTLRATLKCDSISSPDQPISIDVSATGYPDYEFRSMARAVKSHSVNSPVLLGKFRTANGRFSMEKQNYSSVSALSENFNWQAEGKIIGAVFGSEEQKRMVLRAPFWLPAEWDSTLHRRTSGLFLNQGYPLSLDETVEFELPSGLQKVSIPATRENKEGLFKWKMSWQQEKTKLQARLEVELSTGELSGKEVLRFQNQLRDCFAALNVGVEVASQ